jgi:hypothetical protein
MREVRAKTKFHACKTLIQKAYVGRLEGTETLAQRLVNIRQRYYDKATQKLHHWSVQELSQEYQHLIAEVKPTTLPAELPQLDNTWVQAVDKALERNYSGTLQTNQR